MKRSLLIALLAAGLATPAFAFQCPGDMAAIDAALETADISDEDRAKVLELRQQGAEYHDAGQHQQSVDTLAEAMVILGM